MISLQEARKGAADCMRPHPLALVMTTSEEGLVLGTTVLAPMGHDACGIPALAIEIRATTIHRVNLVGSRAAGRTPNRVDGSSSPDDDSCDIGQQAI